MNNDLVTVTLKFTPELMAKGDAESCTAGAVNLAFAAAGCLPTWVDVVDGVIEFYNAGDDVVTENPTAKVPITGVLAGVIAFEEEGIPINSFEHTIQLPRIALRESATTPTL